MIANMECEFNDDRTCIRCGHVIPGAVVVFPYRRTCPAATAVSLQVQQLDDGQYLHECPRCGWHAITETDEPLHHVCGQKEHVPLGDKLESFLTEHGITKERYIEWKKKYKLGEGCGCDWRREVLNHLDELATGLAGKVKNFFRW